MPTEVPLGVKAIPKEKRKVDVRSKAATSAPRRDQKGRGKKMTAESSTQI